MNFWSNPIGIIHKSLHPLILALGFVWRSSKKWTLLLLGIQLLSALIPLCSLYLIKLIVDTLTQVSLSEKPDLSDIYQYLIIFGGIHLIQAFLQNYQQLANETLQQLVTDYMANMIIDKAIAIDMSYYEDAKYHDTLHQTQQEAIFKPVLILQNVVKLLNNGLILLSLIGLLIYLHFSLAIVLTLFALPVIVVKWFYSRKIFEWKKYRTSLERKAIYLNQVLTADVYSKEVRLFNLGKSLKTQFNKIRSTLLAERYQIGKKKVFAGFIAKSIETIALLFCYGFICISALEGTITIGDLVMYIQAFQKGQTSLHQSLQAIVNIYQNRLFLTHLFELLNIQPTIATPSTPKELPTKLEKGVTIKSMDFRYPDAPYKVLKDINLTLKKGEVVAFVGENGCGKTSLIKLLCRLYDPTHGAIYWDDIPIKEADVAELRQKISVVYQDFAKYQFLVEDNVDIGNLEKKKPINRLERATEQSGAIEFIEQLPLKFEQQLGRWFKGGLELSGGQWQKIALSRAFYKDADMIILDEPSSAIDPLSEGRIFKNFRAMVKEKILIIVTHRLYNLKIADKIVVLKEGKVVEEGAYDTLIQQKGYFFKMLKEQIPLENLE